VLHSKKPYGIYSAGTLPDSATLPCICDGAGVSGRTPLETVQMSVTRPIPLCENIVIWACEAHTFVIFPGEKYELDDLYSYNSGQSVCNEC
jgi:hypothetical protein